MLGFRVVASLQLGLEEHMLSVVLLLIFSMIQKIIPQLGTLSRARTPSLCRIEIEVLEYPAHGILTSGKEFFRLQARREFRGFLFENLSLNDCLLLDLGQEGAGFILWLERKTVVRCAGSIDMNIYRICTFLSALSPPAKDKVFVQNFSTRLLIRVLICSWFGVKCILFVKKM